MTGMDMSSCEKNSKYMNMRQIDLLAVYMFVIVLSIYFMEAVGGLLCLIEYKYYQLHFIMQWNKDVVFKTGLPWEAENNGLTLKGEGGRSCNTSSLDHRQCARK